MSEFNINASHETVKEATMPSNYQIFKEWITDKHNQNSIVAYEYAKLVCKELRGASCVMRTPRSFYIYREGDPFVMGWIGYADYRTSPNKTGEKFSFGVYSPHHTNIKYASYNEQHYMSIKQNRDKAVAAAKGILRSYTVGEAATSANCNVARRVCETQLEQKELTDTCATILGILEPRSANSRVHDELTHLYNSGHVFLDPSLREDIGNYLTAYSKSNKSKAATIPMMYVDEVTNRYGDKLYRTCVLRNARQYRPTPHTSDVADEQQRIQEELPDWIVSRVSVLALVDDGTYVEGVGYKHTDKMYTIHIDEDNPFV